MLPALLLLSVLAAGVFTAAAAAQTPQRIVQTTRTAADGTTTVDQHLLDAGETTVHAIGPRGPVMAAAWGPQKRVLIRLRARPTRDRTAPGNSAEISLQRRQLARDLAELDRRRQSTTRSRVTREYATLFSGVAATVDVAAIEEIRRLPNVAAVHDDVKVRAALTQSVPLIGASSVSGTYDVTGAGVKVAVLDSGIDYTHADLGGCLGVNCKVIGGYDFVNDDHDPRDDNGHGTHVAGIIAANGTLKGVAPGATLLAYKVLDSSANGYSSDVIAALEQATLDGAHVANLSFGGEGSPDDPASQALDNATAAGMLSVVAAGNLGPSYGTVESPGTARTALTVGAVNKSWQMAFSSARGFVPDNDQYRMKPELVAPGVDINSTVPTSGAGGHPTGYRLKSGTSMAAPHVAGGAALLLQWKAAQSPDELRNRLVSSARLIDGDVFTAGAGGIDLVAAFGARVLPSVTHVSFGVVSETGGVIVRERKFSLRNTGNAADTLTITATPSLPAGTTLQIIPSSLALQPGETGEVTLRLSVDAAVVPDPGDSKAWSTSVSVTGGTQTVKLPAYFLRGSVLTLSFDEIPDDVFLISAHNVHYFSQVGSSLTTLVKTGLWDVLAFYASPPAVVLKEQQNVADHLSLSIDADEATRTVTMRAVDDQEQALDETRFVKELVLHILHFSFGFGSRDDYRLSEMSSRIGVGLTARGPDLSDQKFFISTWAGMGLSSDVTLPASGVPFRRLTQAVTQPTETVPTALVILTGFAVVTEWGRFGSIGGGIRPGPLSRTLCFQSTFVPGGSIIPIQQTSLNELAFPFARVLQGPLMHHDGGTELAVSDSFHFHLGNPSFEPDAVLGAGVERWDLDTQPHALPVDFWNSSSTVRGFGFITPGWVTHTLSAIRRVAGAEPVFSLYRNGVLAGTHPWKKLSDGIPSPAGPHEIRSTSSYTIGGTPGSSQVAISFNTANSDRNPPEVTRFRIEQNGVRTPAPFHPAQQMKPIVQFRVTDRNTAVSAVTLEWRTNGTATWTPLPLTSTGADYAAVLDQHGAIDLRLTATDAAGNRFQEEWIPAVVSAAAPPPEPPSFLTATRAAATTISLAWAPGRSPLGIAGYRLERFPDNATFQTEGSTTSFDDTTGLVDGNAYFYRVSAIDTNDEISPASPYDVATLIELRDDPLVPYETPIRGAHVADLRRAIDAIRQAAGLPSAWTNYAPPAGVVAASAFNELRGHLNEALSIMQLPGVEFVNPVAPRSVIRAADMQSLRDAVK